jgi:hypothetical protein
MEWRENDGIWHGLACSFWDRCSRLLVRASRFKEHLVLPYPMTVIRVLLGALSGSITATTLAWSGLYAYGVLVRHGQGSLFDTNPSAANAFFIAWGCAVVLAAVVGAGLALRGKRS